MPTTTVGDSPVGTAADEDDAEGEDDPEDDAGGAVTSPEDGVLTDGSWAVGDAGTVEFTVGESGLELVDAVAADGWSLSVDEESPEEIEVDFLLDEREYEMEIQYGGGILEIEVDLDIDPADPGTFEVGPGATAELAVEDGSVTLADLAVEDGWDVVEQDTADGEVEVEVRRDDVVWELAADVDDGRLEVEIDFEVEGPFAA